jgi:hypothetical protein
MDNFEDTENERKRKQVKMEPQMDFTVDTQTKSIHLDYINVERVKVNFYLIDLEILFSKTPFISSVSKSALSEINLIGCSRLQLCAALLIRGAGSRCGLDHLQTLHPGESCKQKPCD